MSAPLPLSVKVAFACAALPATATEPTSAVCHPVGSEAVDAVPVAVTWSNDAVASCGAAWLVTAMPTYTEIGIAIVAWPTVVQATPSLDRDAVNVFPARTIRTHFGAVPAAATLVIRPPDADRYWNAAPFDGLTIIAACAADAVSDARIMTPALVQAFTFCTDATRATIEPSPDIGW